MTEEEETISFLIFVISVLILNVFKWFKCFHETRSYRRNQNDVNHMILHEIIDLQLCGRRRTFIVSKEINQSFFIYLRTMYRNKFKE